MRLLALDAALATCSAAVLIDDRVVAESAVPAEHGEAGLLAPLAATVLAQAGVALASLDVIAASVGPGSFTGLRAGLALAWGLATATGGQVIGVTLREAFAQALPRLSGRALWVAIDSRRAGHIFLAADAPFCAVARTTLPHPSGPIALAGDAAPEVAAYLARRGADVLLTEARTPGAGTVAAAALLRLAGKLPPLAATPLYIDPPSARPSG